MDNKYSLKRVYGESATRTSMYPSISSKRQSEMSPAPTVDRTNLDFVSAVLEIAKVVGPRTFISFIDAWDKDVPPLSTNPKASFNTPHGVYGYPLTEANLVKFIQTGHPTNAMFATNRKFFHVYRINPSSKRGAVEIQKSFETNAYRNANNMQEARKDVRELIRLEYLNKRDRLRNTPKSEYDPSDDVRGYMSIDWLLPRGLLKTSNLLSAFKVLNKHYQDLISKEDDDVASETIREEYREEVEIFYEFATNIFFEASMSNKHNYKQNRDAIKNKTPGYLFFVVYYVALSLSSGSRRGAGSAAFSNYLHSIGIKSLIDRGTGTIHPSEPSQSFVINQGPVNNYELIGTYKNELASLSGEDKKNKKTEAIVALINDTSNNINTTTITDPDIKKDKMSALDVLPGFEDFEKFYCKAFKEFDDESYQQMVEDILNISSDQPLSSNPSSCLESMLKFSLSSEEIPDYMKISHTSFMPAALGFELPYKNSKGEKLNKYEYQKVNTVDFFAEYIYCIFKKEIDFAISSESDIRDLIKFIGASDSLFDNLLILYQVYNEDNIENVRKNNTEFSLKSYRKYIKVFGKEFNSNTNTADLLKTESLLSNIFFESYCLLCMFFCKNDFIIQECKDFVIKNILRNPKAKPKDFFELIKTTKIELYTSSATTSQFTKNLRNYNKYLSLSIDILSLKNNMLDYAQLLVSCSSTIYSLHKMSLIEKPSSDADANDFYDCLLEAHSLYLEFLKKFNVEYEKLSYSASPDEVIKATKYLKTSCKLHSPLYNLTGKARSSIFTKSFIEMIRKGILSKEQATELNNIGKEIISLLFVSVVNKHYPGSIERQNLDVFGLDIIQTLEKKIDSALKIANIDEFFSAFEEICNLKNNGEGYKFLHSTDIFIFKSYKFKKVDESMVSESDLLKISSIRKKFSKLCHLANNRTNDENLSNHEKALYKVYLLPALYRLGDIHSSLDINPSLYDSNLEEMRNNIHKDLDDLLSDETNKKFLKNKDNLKLATTEDGIPVFSHRNYMYINKNLLKIYLEKIISGKIQKLRGFDSFYFRMFPLLAIEDHEEMFSLFMTTFLQKSSVTEKIDCIETITNLMPKVSFFNKNQLNIDKHLFSNMICDIINNSAVYMHIAAYGFVVNLMKIIPYIFNQEDAAYIISNMRQTDLSQSKSFDKEIIKLEKIINILKIYNESFELTLRKFIRVILG